MQTLYMHKYVHTYISRYPKLTNDKKVCFILFTTVVKTKRKDKQKARFCRGLFANSIVRCKSDCERKRE